MGFEHEEPLIHPARGEKNIPTCKSFAQPIRQGICLIPMLMHNLWGRLLADQSQMSTSADIWSEAVHVSLPFHQ